MRILVTAGNTQTLIDRVRCITNIFTGRTGASIAVEAERRGHAVTLLTSHPEVVQDQGGLQIHAYRTFADLRQLMMEHIRGQQLDAVIHCAAINDYESGGIYSPTPGTQFHVQEGTWTGNPPGLFDRAAGKVKSDEPELWLRLVRSPKLVDFIRGEWGFSGRLVKFKLEVGLSDAELLAVAERSRQQSQADLMVANTLEGAADWAFLGPLQGQYERLTRPQLPQRLLDVLEAWPA